MYSSTGAFCLSMTFLQAEKEIGVLQKVQKLVQDRYLEGRPRHHQPEARLTTVTSPLPSILFVSSYQDFMALSDEEVQHIFHDRHIVVTDVPARPYTWDRQTLSKFGSLLQQRDIQGELNLYIQLDDS
jgi:hypothetical protein